MTVIKTGPKAFLTPPPLPIKPDLSDRIFNYRGKGSVRHAYHILINLTMADFVTSIVYIEAIDHCEVILRVPVSHVDHVKRTLGIAD